MEEKVAVVDPLGRVQATWDELGFSLRARGYWVMVRTDPHPQKIGSLWLPPKLADFHGGPAHLQTVTSTVLSSGNVSVAREFKAGDRIAFQRLYFTWWRKMEDGTFVGWVDANQVLGFATADFVKQLSA